MNVIPARGAMSVLSLLFLCSLFVLRKCLVNLLEIPFIDRTAKRPKAQSDGMDCTQTQSTWSINKVVASKCDIDGIDPHSIRPMLSGSECRESVIAEHHHKVPTFNKRVELQPAVHFDDGLSVHSK